LKDVARRGITALKWSALLAAVCFPPFLVGFQLWYRPATPFSSAALWPLLLDVPTQLLMVALPEEAFYRGYLQTRLDKAWGARSNVLGARLGAGVVVSNLIFALGHLLTLPYPGRLAVFFPGLAFGWLRAKTGGIGAALVFHALCNLFASYLGASYGLY
jgi:membrane protease YdiL (CAAX protease family)